MTNEYFLMAIIIGQEHHICKSKTLMKIIAVKPIYTKPPDVEIMIMNNCRDDQSQVYSTGPSFLSKPIGMRSEMRASMSIFD